MVLHVQAQDGARYAPGEQVQRVGGVAGEHHHVVLGPGADELADRGARGFQQRGADLGGVARAAVHRGVVGQQLGDVGGHGAQSRRAGGEIEVGVRHVPTCDQRHPEVVAHHRGELA